MNKNKNSKYYVPRAVQWVVVGAVGGFFLVSVIFMLWQGISQYIQNPNVGGLYGYLVTAYLMPLLLFGVAYLLNPRQLPVPSRSFESILLSLAGIVGWSVIISMVPTFLVEQGPRYIETFARFEIITAIIWLVVYLSVLYWLRATKRWR